MSFSTIAPTGWWGGHVAIPLQRRSCCAVLIGPCGDQASTSWKGPVPGAESATTHRCVDILVIGEFGETMKHATDAALDEKCCRRSAVAPAINECAHCLGVRSHAVVRLPATRKRPHTVHLSRVVNLPLSCRNASSPVSERPRTTVSVGALHPGLQC